MYRFLLSLIIRDIKTFNEILEDFKYNKDIERGIVEEAKKINYKLQSEEIDPE